MALLTILHHPDPRLRQKAAAVTVFDAALQALVDDLNKVFIVLTTFVAFTTSVFSASYIGHEIEIGRLTRVISGASSRQLCQCSGTRLSLSGTSRTSRPRRRWSATTTA